MSTSPTEDSMYVKLKPNFVNDLPDVVSGSIAVVTTQTSSKQFLITRTERPCKHTFTTSISGPAVGGKCSVMATDACQLSTQWTIYH